MRRGSRLKLEFDPGTPLRALADGTRWLHVCPTMEMVFAVAVLHDCPLCKEPCPAHLRARALEAQRQAYVEHHAVD